MKIQASPVESSFIKAIGHHPKTKILFVRFDNNSVTKYENVTVSKFNAFLNAPSKGTFFGHAIKPAHKVVQA